MPFDSLVDAWVEEGARAPLAQPCGGGASEHPWDQHPPRQDMQATVTQLEPVGTRSKGFWRHEDPTEVWPSHPWPSHPVPVNPDTAAKGAVCPEHSLSQAAPPSCIADTCSSSWQGIWPEQKEVLGSGLWCVCVSVCVYLFVAQSGRVRGHFPSSTLWPCCCLPRPQGPGHSPFVGGRIAQALLPGRG